jgi:WD40 repeat protein
MRSAAIPVSMPGAAVVLAAALFAAVSARADSEAATSAVAAGGGAVTLSVNKGATWVRDGAGKKPARIWPEGEPDGLAITPDGKWAAILSLRGAVTIVRLLPEVRILHKKFLKVNPWAVAISADGKVVAVGSQRDGQKKVAPKVTLFDVASGKELRSFEHEDDVLSLGFTPDGKAVAVGSPDKKVRLRSVATGKLLWEVSPHRGAVCCVAFFPGGKKIATGSLDGSVCVLDAKTGKTLTSYLAHRRMVEKVAVSPDGKYVGSFGLDGAIHVGDVENAKDVAHEKLPSGAYGLAFSKTCLVVSDGPTVRLLDLKTGKLGEPRKP